MSVYGLLLLFCIIFLVCFVCYFLMQDNKSRYINIMSSIYCSIGTTIILIFTIAVLIELVSGRWILKSVMSIENANTALYIKAKDGHYIAINSVPKKLITEEKSSASHD